MYNALLEINFYAPYRIGSKHLCWGVCASMCLYVWIIPIAVHKYIRILICVYIHMKGKIKSMGPSALLASREQTEDIKP